MRWWYGGGTVVVRWYNGGRAAVVTRGVRMKEKKAAPRGMGEWGKKEGRGEGGKGCPIAMKKKDAGSRRGFRAQGVPRPLHGDAEDDRGS